MRKMVLTFTIIIVSLALLGNSQAAMGGIKLKDYPHSSQLKEFLSLKSPRQLGEIFIVPLEPFDERGCRDDFPGGSSARFPALQNRG